MAWRWHIFGPLLFHQFDVWAGWMPYILYRTLDNVCISNYSLFNLFSICWRFCWQFFFFYINSTLLRAMTTLTGFNGFRLHSHCSQCVCLCFFFFIFVSLKNYFTFEIETIRSNAYYSYYFCDCTWNWTLNSNIKWRQLLTGFSLLKSIFLHRMRIYGNVLPEFQAQCGPLQCGIQSLNFFFFF